MTPEPSNEYQNLVEAVARAMAVSERADPDKVIGPDLWTMWQEYADLARAALSALKPPHAGDDEIKRLRDMFETQAWAQDWQHNIVPPGKPAHELACAAIRALPKLLAAYPLHTPPAKGTPHV